MSRISSSNPSLSPEQQEILALKKEVKNLKEANNILKNICVLFLGSGQEKYTVIHNMRAKGITLAIACRCLAVSALGCYAWRKRKHTLRQEYADLELGKK